MKTIKKETAIQLSNLWHGGEWSCLYSFASSGQITFEDIALLLREVQSCLEPEFYLHPCELSAKSKAELTRLKRYFENEILNKFGIVTTWQRHYIYGYMLPFFKGENIQGIKPINKLA